MIRFRFVARDPVLISRDSFTSLHLLLHSVCVWHVGLRIWLGHSIENVTLSSYVSDSKVSNIAIQNLYVSPVKNTARISIHLLGFSSLLFQVKFWIEGVLLLIVGSLGFLGNLLTLAVLAREESFTQIIKTARLDTVFIDNWDSVTILAEPKIWFQS